MRKRLDSLALFAVLLLAAAGPLQGQAHLGGQISVADDADFGIGGRIVFDLLQRADLEFIGSFDWFFPDEPPGEDRDYWELNGNVAYFFDLESAPSVAPYLGGGLNIAHASRDGASDTDGGINILGGARFSQSPVKPFVELRIELGGGEQFVLSGGLVFF